MQSQTGIGTTFHIFLPASEGEISEDKPADSSEKESPVPGKGRVLVMDDEAMIRELAVQMLTYLGYEVACSEDGEEAIELYKKAMDSGKCFDIVILDLTVRGGMGGKETMAKLFEIDSDVRGIVSSGYSENLVMSDFKTFGFIDAIPKPYKLNELASILHEVITGGKDNNATCFLQN